MEDRWLIAQPDAGRLQLGDQVIDVVDGEADMVEADAVEPREVGGARHGRPAEMQELDLAAWRCAFQNKCCLSILVVPLALDPTMLIQVVLCHPLSESYNHALFGVVVETLQKSGHEVVATDLYRENFQPVMTIEERRTYMGPQYDSSGVEAYTTLLQRLDGIILCFPHWWFAMPAMLKGWVDRVWGPGIAFTYDAKDGHLGPNLGNIKLFGVVTTYGSPWWIVRLFAGDAGRKVMMRGLKPMCARGARSFYLAHYDIDHSSPASRQAFIEKVRRTVSRL